MSEDDGGVGEALFLQSEVQKQGIDRALGTVSEHNVALAGERCYRFSVELRYVDRGEEAADQGPQQQTILTLKGIGINFLPFSHGA